MNEPVVEKRPHPGGLQGIQYSLDKVAEKAIEGKDDPIVRSHTTRVLKKAGFPDSTVGRAQAILDELRETTGWVPDPVGTEFIGAARYLTPDENGERLFEAGDCDDLVVTLLGRLQSVGIKCRVVGHSYSDDAVISHVLGQIWDEASSSWKYVEPSVKNLQVGEAYMPTWERTIELPSGNITCDASACSITEKPEDELSGNYVGLSGVGVSDLPSSVRALLIAVRDNLSVTWERVVVLSDGLRDLFAEAGRYSPSEVEAAGWSAEKDQDLETLRALTGAVVTAIDEASNGGRKVAFIDAEGKRDLAIELLPHDEASVAIVTENGVTGASFVDPAGAPANFVAPAGVSGPSAAPVVVAPSVDAAIVTVGTATSLAAIVSEYESALRAAIDRVLLLEAEALGPSPDAGALAQAASLQEKAASVFAAADDVAPEHSPPPWRSAVQSFERVLYVLGAIVTIYGAAKAFQALRRSSGKEATAVP